MNSKFCLMLFLIFSLSFLIPSNAQVLNSKGGNIYVSGGAMNVTGKMILDSVSNIENAGIIRTDSLKTKGIIAMRDSVADMRIYGGLILQKGKIVLNGNTLNIYNPDTLAIKKVQGGIVSETYDFTSQVNWFIGDSKEKYVVPFINEAGDNVSITFQTTSTGTSEDGFLTFSTFPTDPDFIPNNSPAPYGIPFGNSISIVDRYWGISANNYTSPPQGTLTLKYSNDDISGGNSITESELRGGFFNGSSWEMVDAILTTSENKIRIDSSSLLGIWAASTEDISLSDDLGASCEEAIIMTGTPIVSMAGESLWFKFTATGTSMDFNFCQLNEDLPFYIDSVRVYEGGCEELELLIEDIFEEQSFLTMEVESLTATEDYFIELHKSPKIEE